MFTKVGLGNSPDVSLAFLADPVSVTIASTTQKVLVTSSKALGSDSLGAVGGAQGLNLYICRETGGTLTTVGTGVFGLRVAPDTRQLFTLSASVSGLTPGAYNFGLCGLTTSDPGDWNSNEFGYTTALVTQ
jgi:hypothetical protein